MRAIFLLGFLGGGARAFAPRPAILRAHAGGAVRSPFSALSDSDLLGGTALSETAPPPAGGDDVEAATRHYAQCGKCRSVYALSLDALGRSGTKVSCSVCGHSWWQTADRLQELREGWTYGDIPDGRLEQIKANVAAGKKPMETKPKVKGEATLFIGNVPFDYGEDEVADLVKPHAEVASVVLVLQPDGRSKGYAFVDLVKAGEAEKAIEELNGQELNGRSLNVAMGGKK